MISVWAICGAILAIAGMNTPSVLAQDDDIKGVSVQGISGQQLTRIAIPDFEAVDGRNGGLTPNFFRDIIYKDLEMLSDFERVKNQQSVEEAHKRDLGQKEINYDQWSRVEPGLAFVLKSRYWVEGGEITVESFLYDLVYRRSAFPGGTGLRYKKYPISDARKLAHRISDDIVQAVFPDSVGIARTRIAFVSQRGSQQYKEVFVMDADGQGVERLTFDSKGARTPCWGLNATEIYYTSYKDVNPDLMGVQLGTRKTWFISRRTGLNYAPAWNPNNQRIVLTLGMDSNNEIYSMDRSGKTPTLQRLTHSAAIDTSPCWNPAGNMIAYNSDDSGTPQIYIMNADGTGKRRLTRMGSYNTAPSWSPKGDCIVFCGRDNEGTFNIFTVNADGTNWRQLTSGQGRNEDPCWAPDGRHIVFSSNRKGADQIFIMRFDGASQHQLTTEGLNQSPSWGPIPTEGAR